MSMSMQRGGRPMEYCDRGVCAAAVGHEGTCAEASGWDEVFEVQPLSEREKLQVAQIAILEIRLASALDLVRSLNALVCNHTSTVTTDGDA